jgi:hypothetical protein
MGSSPFHRKWMGAGWAKFKGKIVFSLKFFSENTILPLNFAQPAPIHFKRNGEDPFA